VRNHSRTLWKHDVCLFLVALDHLNGNTGDSVVRLRDFASKRPRSCYHIHRLWRFIRVCDGSLAHVARPMICAVAGLLLYSRTAVSEAMATSEIDLAKGAMMEFTRIGRTRVVLVLAALLGLGIACSNRTSNPQYKESVKNKESVKTALEQADLRDVSVSEDASKNTVTLTGTLHSDDAKTRAGEIAQSNAGTRVVANEISVEPVGNESQARKMESNLDDGIESNYKASLISKGLDKQNIRFSAKNGVLTLAGSVKNPNERKEAQLLAQNTPNVSQVVNQIEIRR
jgi:osmotically-inducible protein OsmY